MDDDVEIIAPVKKRKLSFETVGTIAAVLIGACALFVAWDQAQVMRKQQHAMVWPILQMEPYFNIDQAGYTMVFDVKNAGVGPALIETVTLTDRLGKTFTFRDLIPFAENELGKTNSELRRLEGRILSADESVRIISLNWDADKIQAKKASEFYNTNWGFKADICYCSVHSKCWISSNSGSQRPTSVKSCPAEK